MLKISHKEALQVMACCHEGLCPETLVWVPRHIWMGLMGHWASGRKGNIADYVIIYVDSIQVPPCKMLSCRHVKLNITNGSQCAAEVPPVAARAKSPCVSPHSGERACTICEALYPRGRK